MIPSFTIPSNASIPNDGLVTLSPSHQKVYDLVLPYLQTLFKQQQQQQQQQKDEQEQDGDGDDDNQKDEEILGVSFIKEEDILLDEVLFDFGCRYRLVVHQINRHGDDSQEHEDDKEDLVIAIHVAIEGWDDIKESAILALRSKFGERCVITLPSASSSTTADEDADRETMPTSVVDQLQQESFRMMNSVCLGYNVTIQIQRNSLPHDITMMSSRSSSSPESCAQSLSELCVLILGHQFENALTRLGEKNNNNSKEETNDKGEKEEENNFLIPTQIQRYMKPSSDTLDSKVVKEGSSNADDTTTRKKKKKYTIPAIVSSHTDRVTIVFPIHFEDETDCALARLYLQQFEQAQRTLSGKKNTPICEFRRKNEPPREIETFLPLLHSRRTGNGSVNNSITNNSVDDDDDDDGIVGFFSFTFLENHAETKKKREVATANMIMFLRYIEYHIKCTKSHMHTRMRQKKDALLEGLFRK